MNSCIGFGIAAVALAAVAAAASAADCPANTAPAPFTAHYAVHASRGMLALDGDTTIAFARNGNEYRLTMSTNASGLLSSRQESRGAIGDGVLIPVHYSESSNRRGASSATIDWRERRVTFADGSEAPTRVALQDRASLIVQLASAWRARPEAAALEFAVVSLRRVSAYKFVRRGTERLDLPAGAVDAERFERVDHSGDDHFDVWLARTHCALPVRMRLRDHRGYEIDQRLRELRFE